MRKLLALALLAGALAPVGAQDPTPKQPAKIVPQPPAPKVEITLRVGDKAPPLRATKWLQGAEVKEFAAGKTYVVEFWATWCGPCIVMMPHMGELQAQYKDKGVTFIGFTAQDKNNTQEKVEAMVMKKGPALGYTFAYSEDRETSNAWMRAAGRNGIPCCFVVDKEGKIAYIGHPMYLDVVLPKVVAGKWTEDDTKALDGIEKEVSAVFKAASEPNPEVYLDKLAAFEKAHPELAGIPYFNGSRIGALLKAKKIEDAKKLCEKLIAKGTKTSDDLLLGTVASALRSPAADKNKDLLALSLKSAEAALKIAGEKDWRALLGVADAQFANGNAEQARAIGAKALAATEKESAAIKAFVEKQIKTFEKKSD